MTAFRAVKVPHWHLTDVLFSWMSASRHKRSFPRSQRLTLSNHSACGSFDRLVAAGERQSWTEGRHPLGNLVAGFAFLGKE
jgi:hypothetical protein